jgi:Tripartite tricarboxylate transporter family receptor
MVYPRQRTSADRPGMWERCIGGRVPNVMLVNPSVPAKTVPEFISYAKANPTKVNMGSQSAVAKLEKRGDMHVSNHRGTLTR